MIEIRSFFKLDDNFVLCSDCSSKIRGTIDSDYEDIEGAIELKINNKTMIDKTMWDFVDQLWRTLLDAVAHITIKKHYMGYFPDQAIEIILKDMNDVQSELRINEDQGVVVDKQLFINDILDGAKSFFGELIRLRPDDDFSDDLELIKAIRNKDLKYLSNRY